MDEPRLVGFSGTQEDMIRKALAAMSEARYEVSRFEELIWVDLPAGFRAMCLENGAALGDEAFSSQDMLNHALEEKYLHLIQKSLGRATEFGKGTARYLEYEVDDIRKFPRPDF